MTTAMRAKFDCPERRSYSMPLIACNDILLLSTTLNVAYDYIKPNPEPATVRELQERIMLEHKYMRLLRTLACSIF
jgi:hypothetical protein